MKKCMSRKKNAKQLVNNLEKFYYDTLMKYENTQNWLNVSPVSSSVKKLDCQLFTFVYPNEYLALKI